MLIYLSKSSDDLCRVIAHSMMVEPDTVKQVQDSDGREVYVIDLSGQRSAIKFLFHATSRLKSGLRARYLDHILEGVSLKVFVRKVSLV